MRSACSWLLLSCIGCSSDGAKAHSASPDSGVVVSPEVDAASIDAGAPTATDPGPVKPLACKADPPAACPTPKPSFKNDIVPLLNAKCGACHTDQPDHPWPLVDYNTVHDWKAQFTQDLLACTMPPVDAGATLTDQERGLFIAWVVCGAPYN
jgi:hypothetical protein